MIDCGWNVKWDVMTAVRRVQAFEEYGLHWIEEPLGAWDPEGYANLRSQDHDASSPTARRSGTSTGFERVLATGTVDVVGHRPGPGRGHHRLQEGRPSGSSSTAASRTPTAWSSAICSAASLAISFSTPSFKLFEFKPLRNPMQHELVTEPFEHVDGWVYPPTKPGLGIEVIEEVVDRYRSEKVLAAGA